MKNRPVVPAADASPAAFFRAALPAALLTAVFVSGAFLSCAFLSCALKEGAMDPPIITSATYQHTQYDGRRQAVEVSAARDDVPPFIVTYFQLNSMVPPMLK
jgi:hypothetical protein